MGTGFWSSDNVKGVVVALVSSAFIGASFIIKKKGLQGAAAASGVLAGVGGYSYLIEPLWWSGMFIILVTPLGALSIIVSAVLANFILKEKLHKLGILGCIMCVVGSIVIVSHAPQESSISSVQEVWHLATKTAFLLYVVSVIAIVMVLIFHFAPWCGHSNELIFTGICSLMGSLSVMSVKALGIALKLTFEGRNQLIYPETWLFTTVVVTCVIMQINYLNKALDTFNTELVSPIYYVMFTTLTILASIIMFRDWDGLSGGKIVSEICGFIIVLSGTVLLHITKDYEKSPLMNMYTPLSSSLSARFSHGNEGAHDLIWHVHAYIRQSCHNRGEGGTILPNSPKTCTWSQPFEACLQEN